MKEHQGQRGEDLKLAVPKSTLRLRLPFKSCSRGRSRVCTHQPSQYECNMCSIIFDKWTKKLRRDGVFDADTTPSSRKHGAWHRNCASSKQASNFVPKSCNKHELRGTDVAFSIRCCMSESVRVTRLRLVSSKFVFCQSRTSNFIFCHDLLVGGQRFHLPKDQPITASMLESTCSFV